MIKKFILLGLLITSNYCHAGLLLCGQSTDNMGAAVNNLQQKLSGYSGFKVSKPTFYQHDSVPFNYIICVALN